jgi:anthranilate 1,2-dioxygenase small subunit
MATRTKIDVETRLAVEDFLYAYADCLDHGDIEDWADFFTEDCTYTVISKENHDLGLPLGTIFAEKKGGIRDRITAVTQTTVYHQRALTHMITNTRVLGDDGESLTMTANYAVLETLPNQYTKILNSGRYLGTLVRDQDGPSGLRIRKLDCIFDSALVPASIIYPI